MRETGGPWGEKTPAHTEGTLQILKKQQKLVIAEAEQKSSPLTPSPVLFPFCQDDVKQVLGPDPIAVLKKPEKVVLLKKKKTSFSHLCFSHIFNNEHVLLS